jgi:hypothetical protein
MSLDDDLAAWAVSVRLPADEADAIFARIVATPFATAAVAVAEADPAPALDPGWWRGFNAGFATRMVASTAPMRLAA